MNIQLRYGRTETRRRILPWAVASALMVAIAWPGLIVDAPAYAANMVETVDSWIDQILQRGGDQTRSGAGTDEEAGAASFLPEGLAAHAG